MSIFYLILIWILIEIHKATEMQEEKRAKKENFQFFSICFFFLTALLTMDNQCIKDIFDDLMKKIIDSYNFILILWFTAYLDGHW